MSNNSVPTMSLPQAVTSVFSKYATFSGRARRRELCYWSLFCFFVFVIAHIIDNTFGMTHFIIFYRSYGLFFLLSWAILIVPTIGVYVRRLHDIGESGWWWLLLFIPLVGTFNWIVWHFQKSQKGTNKYGESPKEPAQALGEE